MILLIDNYDSFTYNVKHYLNELGAEVKIYRNDKITIDEIRQIKPKAIVISPGPCTPDEAGICLNLINELKTTFPILPFLIALLNAFAILILPSASAYNILA